MNAKEVQELINSQIGNDWSVTNHHGVDLRRALIKPEKITVIERWVRNGKVHDQTILVWLVLIESPIAGDGYRIVCKELEPVFGLASEGFPSDKYLVVSGWHGDFMTTFLGM